MTKEVSIMIVHEDIGTRGGACNVGVRTANGGYIAFTDADCVVPKDWLKNLVEHFNGKEIACVGGPNITPEDDTEFAKCVGVVLSFLSKPGSRYVLNIDKVIFLLALSLLNAVYLWGRGLSILVIGGIGIGLMSLYLGIKTRSSGFGYFRGVVK